MSSRASLRREIPRLRCAALGTASLAERTRSIRISYETLLAQHVLGAGPMGRLPSLQGLGSVALRPPPEPPLGWLQPPRRAQRRYSPHPPPRHLPVRPAPHRTAPHWGVEHSKFFLCTRDGGDAPCKTWKAAIMNVGNSALLGDGAHVAACYRIVHIARFHDDDRSGCGTVNSTVKH